MVVDSDNSGPDRNTPIGVNVMMSVQVNGKLAQTRARTLHQLLLDRDLGEAKVATAVNGEFVPAARREQTCIREGDRIEIVAPRQGG